MVPQQQGRQHPFRRRISWILCTVFLHCCCYWMNQQISWTFDVTNSLQWNLPLTRTTSYRMIPQNDNNHPRCDEKTLLRITSLSSSFRNVNNIVAIHQNRMRHGVAQQQSLTTALSNTKLSLSSDSTIRSSSRTTNSNELVRFIDLSWLGMYEQFKKLIIPSYFFSSFSSCLNRHNHERCQYDKGRRWH